MRLRGPSAAGNDPAEDRQVGSLVRRALIDQVENQEPSPAVWRAIEARTVRPRPRSRPTLSWATLASGFIALALMLGSTFTFWGYDGLTNNQTPVMGTSDAVTTPELTVPPSTAGIQTEQPSAPAAASEAQRPAAASDTQRPAGASDPPRPIAAASDAQHQPLASSDSQSVQAAPSNVQHATAPPAVASSARTTAPETAQSKQSSPSIEYGPDLPKAVRPGARRPAQQPVPATPAIEDVMRGRSAIPI